MDKFEAYKSNSILSTPLYLDPGLALHSRYQSPQVDPTKSQDAAEIRQQMVQAGRQFEAYFISYLLKVMKNINLFNIKILIYNTLNYCF